MWVDPARLTPRMRDALAAAQELARRSGRAQVEPEHLVAAACADGETAALLRGLGLSAGAVADAVAELVQTLPEPARGDPPEPGDALRRLLDEAARAAAARGELAVGLGHALLALVQTPRCAAAEALRRAGVTRGRLQAALGAPPSTVETPRRPPTPTLDRFTRDLTQLAGAGALDPVAGRDRELRRLIQVLLRRTKNNPVLVGDPGVGKTAIVEGLAQRIADGDVPARLAGRRLLQLDLGALVAGARFRGDFEERVQKLVDEVRAQAGAVLLFIDEIHLLTAAGAGAGAIDAANLLKPALGRGELQCIGATTVAEWRQHVERDAALERRLQPIRVDEPGDEAVRAMLRAQADRLTAHHDVAISDGALEAAARLTRRYVAGRALPDKAIDALDEAAARLRLALDTAPDDLDDLTRDAARAAPLRADALRSAAAAVAERWRERGRTVGADDVARVVGEWTGIPLGRLVEGERMKLGRLAERLRARVIGQDRAVERVAAALRRGRVGLADPRRPIGSFLFVGPTGVGKTELARQLAALLFDDPAALVRLDMSEYQERHTAARLTGAPPGYIGHDDGGQLTEAVRRRPWAVVLLDEIDKAHPEVHDVLLQVLDEGRLTDGQGRTVRFNDAVIVLTANLADESALGRRFRPELVNRLDEIVRFQPLVPSAVARIAELQLGRVRRLAAEQGIALVAEEEAVAHLARVGYDPVFGARALARAVARLVQDPLADRIVAGRLAPGDRVALVLEGGALVLRESGGQNNGSRPIAAEGGGGLDARGSDGYRSL